MSDEHGQDPDDPNFELSDEITKKWDPERLLRMVSKRAGKGQRLDVATRAKYERMLGADFSNVRLYTGEFAEEITRAHNAEAVTIASTGMILMGGSPDLSPATSAGQGLLAHELTHVAQAQPGMHRKSRPGGDMTFTEEHEQEAEQVQAKVAAGDDGAKGKADAKAAEQEKKARIEKAVKERVLEMLGEAARIDRQRNGGGSSRP